MSKEKEAQLSDIGKKLGKTQTKDALTKLLRQAAALLAELDQSPPPSTHSAMKGCSEALVTHPLLRHKDKDVRLLVAICISEIMRIVAPDAPYDDDTLKEIFQLIVTIFQGLDDVNSPSFARRVNILETVAKVRSCVVMLDLECDDLILEMFHTFFDTASDEHPQNVFNAMRNVLTLVLEESEKIPAPMLEVILKNLLKQNKEVSAAAHKLAVAVVEKCADKLEPYVQRFLTSVMLEGKVLDSGLHEDYHEVIYEIYCCAPQMLLAVIPNLTQELVTDQVDVRLKAVELLGQLFALPGRHVAQEYRQLFSEFLKRFNDKVVEVRVAVVNCAKVCLEANPSGEQATEILAAMQDRLLDFDDKVRLTVVKAICDLAKTNPKWVPTDILRKVADRLRDKKVFVRKDTLQKLMEVYRTYCTKCFEGSNAMDKEFEWIPSKIVRCCYDKDCKDFKPQGMEIVFIEELFPSGIPVEEQTKHWILSFSTFDENEKRALQVILSQKQRLQQEMQAYLSSRQKAKEEDNLESEKKIQSSFKGIANQFVDPIKAEENLQKLHQMKDNNIFKALSTLLSPSTTFAQAATVREDLLKRIGEKHPQYEFMKILATKCSYVFFGREHVQVIMKELSAYKESGTKDLVTASLSLLVEIAAYCPVLMEDTEEQLLGLLKDPDETIKEGVVHIISKAGGSFREKVAATEGSSNVNLTLEQLCVEGNRKQAKYAVSAIAAMTADSGLKALSVLYGRLVDQLEDNTHLPTILQSLGCIAQNAMPIFETREDEIIKFVVRNVLRRPNTQENADSKPDGDTPSDSVLLKIYALKALVKSFLPKANAHQRTRLPGLLKVLVKILACGEIADEVKTSETDKAHLRLAAAKGVLRLARRWDSQIPTDVFHLVVMAVQDTAVHVRRALLLKIHQYLKDRSLNQKYASAYALSAVDIVKEIAVEARRCMAEFVDTYRKEARKAITGLVEGTAITLHPEYALVYLVHVLAHHPNYPVASGDIPPDPAAYEPFYRELIFFLRALVHQEAEGRSESGKKEDGDNLPAILAILRTIKNSEDAIDKAKTENLYAICDIAILITKDLGRKRMSAGDYPGVIPLPSLLYKAVEPCEPSEPAEGAVVVEGTEGAEVKKAELENVKVDLSHLPPCFTDKDVLAKFKTGTSTRSGQPSSPRGQKRGKRIDDGDSSSEDEAELEEGEPNHKKGKHDNDKVAKGTAAETGVTIKGPARGGRKLIDKNGTAKKPVKKAESEEETVKTPVENSSAKRKRGRPKGSGNKKDEAVSGDEAAGLSSDTTPTTSAKKGKPATTNQRSLLEYVQKKPGRPAKNKPEQEGHDGSAQKKVAAGQSPLGTPKSPGKKAMATEKVPFDNGSLAMHIQSGSPAWKTEDDRGGDESLVGCGIKVWWPLDRKFYKGTVQAFDAKKKKHKILYDDGEQEILNLAKERWELTGKNKTSAKKAPTTPVTPSGTKYPEPKKLKITTKTPPGHRDEVSGPSEQSKELSSSKPVKQAHTPKEAVKAPKEVAKVSKETTRSPKDAAKAPKEAGKVPKEPKPASAKEQAASAYEFNEDEPMVDKDTSKQEKSNSTQKGSTGKQGKVEKATSSVEVPAEEPESEGAKDVADDPPSEGQSEVPADDDEPLDNWRSRRRKGKPVAK